MYLQVDHLGTFGLKNKVICRDMTSRLKTFFIPSRYPYNTLLADLQYMYINLATSHPLPYCSDYEALRTSLVHQVPATTLKGIIVLRVDKMKQA